MLWIVLLVSGALIIGAGAFSMTVQKRLRDSQDWVSHTRTVQLTLARILGNLQRVRADARTYLLTSRQDVRDDLEDSRAVLLTDLAQLHELVTDNPAQQRRVEALDAAVQGTLRTYDSELADGTAFVRTTPAWWPVRDAAVELDQAEAKLLVERLGTLDSTAQHNSASVAALVLLSLLGLGVIASLSRSVTRLQSNEVIASLERERMRVLTDLAKKELDFRTLADNMNQLAWMASADGSIFWYNRRWYEYTGTTPEQMLGWGWTAVHDPAELERVIAGFKSAIASGRNWEDTFPLRALDGTYRWFLSRAMPIRDADGRVTQWFGTNTDITESRRHQQRLLEDDHRKDEFLATLSHELRNPLAAIVNAAQLLTAPDLAHAKQLWCSKIILRQTTHLAHLLDDLLDISRITRGRLELRREKIELREVLDSAVEAVQPQITARRHQLKVEVPDELPSVVADPVRLAQVITNLLNNASKFTDTVGMITLRAENRGNALRLSVSDDGIGLSTEQLNEVFNMFAQVKSALARSSGGLGIGLALSKGIVELHGGSIYASSAGLGKGAEFVVELPLDASSGPLVPLENGTSQGQAQARRILVADDNEDAANTLSMMLESFGHKVATVYDGAAALSQADKEWPEIAVLDIGMPKMNGYELAQQLRGRPGGENIVLIAVTGWGQHEDRVAAREVGFDHHLTKPVDAAALARLIAEWVPKTGRSATEA
jgi:PAS domain S-box-containing protein